MSKCDCNDNRKIRIVSGNDLTVEAVVSVWDAKECVYVPMDLTGASDVALNMVTTFTKVPGEEVSASGSRVSAFFPAGRLGKGVYGVEITFRDADGRCRAFERSLIEVVESSGEATVESTAEGETGDGLNITVDVRTRTVRIGGTGATDYPSLTGKPSINGVVLEGDKTPEELGMYSKEETDEKFETKSHAAEADKRVQGMLDGKVDKIPGKGLSANDLTDERAGKVDMLETGGRANEHLNGAGKYSRPVRQGYGVSVAEDNTVSVDAQVIARQSDVASVAADLAAQKAKEQGDIDRANAAVAATLEKVNQVQKSNGYCTCVTGVAAAEKTIVLPDFRLSTNVRLIVMMEKTNVASDVKLNVNGTGAYPLYYNGEPVTAVNRWNAGEIVDVCFNGTAYYATSFIPKDRREGYCTCVTGVAAAEKTIVLPDFRLSTNVRLIVMMEKTNVASDVKLNVNGTGAYPLYYNGEPVTAVNRWNAGEIVDVCFNGTAYFATKFVNNISLKTIDSRINNAISATGFLNLPAINEHDYSLECIHHDNFSRTMEGWEIGKNSLASSSLNGYEYVMDKDTNDGLVVNGSAVFVKNVSQQKFSLRKISESQTGNFLIETNAPTIDNYVGFAFNFQDTANFDLVRLVTATTSGYQYYDVFLIKVRASSEEIVWTTRIRYRDSFQVASIYYVDGFFVFKYDDECVGGTYWGTVDSGIYLCARNNMTYEFKFVNLFNIMQARVWNPNYAIDAGQSVLPDTVINANEGGYELSDNPTRWSRKSEHFVLHSTDTMIHNGIRSERSVTQPLLRGNLRDLDINFDVLFPASVELDTATSAYHDTFFQLHDRQSDVARNNVCFNLMQQGGDIMFSQTSTFAPGAGSDAIISQFLGKISEVKKGEWMHFRIFIRERYDERQHPFIRIDIDNRTVYESRLPNAYNDVVGSMAQYGEYKNNWNLISKSDRYFDNMTINY